MTTLREEFQRKLGLKKFRAELGNLSGTVEVPGFPDSVYITYPASNGEKISTIVRFEAIMKKQPGNPCIVGYNDDGELAVLRPYVKGQIASGWDTLENNPADERVNKYISQSQITSLLTYLISSAGDSMLVAVSPLVYVLDGVVHDFPGEQVDLTSYIPASAGKQCLAYIVLDTADDTIDIEVTSDFDAADPLVPLLLQEVVDLAPAAHIPSAALRLYHGQTGLMPGNIDAGGDEFWDARPIVNTPFSSSGSDLTAIHTDVSAEIDGLDEKETPVDDDELVIEDSEDGFSKKKVKISNLAGGSAGSDDAALYISMGVGS